VVPAAALPVGTPEFVNVLAKYPAGAIEHACAPPLLVKPKAHAVQIFEEEEDE